MTHINQTYLLRNVIFLSIIISLQISSSTSPIPADFDPLHKIVFEQHSHNNYSTLVIFFSQAASPMHDDFFQQLAKTPSVLPMIVIEEEYIKANRTGRIMTIEKYFNANTLSVIFLNSLAEMQPPLLKLAIAVLNGICASSHVVVVLKPPVSNELEESNAGRMAISDENLLEFFNRSWSDRFLYLVIYHERPIFESLSIQAEVICYTPFPIISYEQHADASNLSELNLFANKMQNVKGYTLRSPVKQDSPRSFTYINPKGQSVTGGITSKIFSTFIQYINATFEEIKVPNSSEYVKISEIVNLIHQNQVEISYHATSGSIFSRVNYSYPYGKSLWCIIVPYSDEIPRSLYFLLPFEKEVWLTILGLWIYQVVAECITNWIIKSEADFGRAILNGLTKLLFIGSPTCVATDPRLFDFLVMALESLMGFIISNFYLAFLSSFLSVTIFLPQITSWQLLEQSSLRIQIIDYEMEQYYSTEPDIPKFLEKMFYKVERDVFAKDRNNLNKSFAYTSSTQAASFLLAQQKFSHRPIFRNPDFCLSDDLLAFPIRADTPFYEPFQLYTMKILESGLQRFWEQQSYEEAFEAQILHRIEQETLHHQKLQFQHFLAAWSCLVIGYVAGSVCFIWERLRSKGMKLH